MQAVEKLNRRLDLCIDPHLKSYQSNSDELSHEEVERIENGFKQTRRDMRSQQATQGQTQSSRAAVRGNLTGESLSQSGGGGKLGHVVDLAFVSDEREAKLLSWAAGARLAEGHKSGSRSNSSTSSRKCKSDPEGRVGGGFMSALVYATEREAKRAVRESGESYFALDRMVSVRSNFQGEDDDDGELDETWPKLVSASKGSVIPGNPRQMVKLLEIPAKTYDLRGTVFHSIFKDKIIMNSNKDAEKFRSNLILERNPNVPTIYTLKEGRCYRGDGLVTSDDTIPAKLNFVFGEKPGEQVSVLENISIDLDNLEDIKSNVTLRDAVYLELQELKHRQREVQGEIDRIRRGPVALPTPPNSRRGGGGATKRGRGEQGEQEGEEEQKEEKDEENSSRKRTRL